MGDRLVPFTRFDEFRQRFLNDPADEPNTGNTGQTALLSQFIDMQLLIKAALDEGVTLTEEDRQELSSILTGADETDVRLPDDEVLVHKFINLKLAPEVNVSEEEMREYYRQHSSQFIVEDVYRVKEILVEDETLANQIHEELLLGGKSRFGAFARQFSIAPSAVAGGDLGYFQRGQLPPEFEKIVLSLKPGSFSAVLRTQYGYHIFYLEEVIRRHAQKFYEARESILGKLRSEKERMTQNTLVQTLYEKYQPVLYTKALDFQPEAGILNTNILLEDEHAK
jgi:parvulin-like peptidyl-prolyl isomerase